MFELDVKKNEHLNNEFFLMKERLESYKAGKIHTQDDLIECAEQLKKLMAVDARRSAELYDTWIVLQAVHWFISFPDFSKIAIETLQTITSESSEYGTACFKLAVIEFIKIQKLLFQSDSLIKYSIPLIEIIIRLVKAKSYGVNQADELVAEIFVCLVQDNYQPTKRKSLEEVYQANYSSYARLLLIIIGQFLGMRYQKHVLVADYDEIIFFKDLITTFCPQERQENLYEIIQKNLIAMLQIIYAKDEKAVQYFEELQFVGQVNISNQQKYTFLWAIIHNFTVNYIQISQSNEKAISFASELIYRLLRRSDGLLSSYSIANIKKVFEQQVFFSSKRNQLLPVIIQENIIHVIENNPDFYSLFQPSFLQALPKFLRKLLVQVFVINDSEYAGLKEKIFQGEIHDLESLHLMLCEILIQIKTKHKELNVTDFDNRTKTILFAIVRRVIQQKATEGEQAGLKFFAEFDVFEDAAIGFNLQSYVFFKMLIYFLQNKPDVLQGDDQNIQKHALAIKQDIYRKFCPTGIRFFHSKFLEILRVNILLLKKNLEVDLASKPLTEEDSLSFESKRFCLQKQ